LEAVNGIEVVVEAMRYFKVRPWRTPRSDLSRYVFVGEGSFRKQAEKVGKVTGMVAEPGKYLAEAEVVIASSYLAILEAAAMGKRIVAIANNPLKRDYLEGHPIRKYFEVVGDAEELAHEIIKRSHPGIRQGDSFAQNLAKARKWARGQTAERLADEYEELWGIK
jgi:glycosyltransferase involved in cell wall biosynthesis